MCGDVIGKMRDVIYDVRGKVTRDAQPSVIFSVRDGLMISIEGGRRSHGRTRYTTAKTIVC